jgi:hypothetical protein
MHLMYSMQAYMPDSRLGRRRAYFDESYAVRRDQQHCQEHTVDALQPCLTACRCMAAQRLCFTIAITFLRTPAYDTHTRVTALLHNYAHALHPAGA